MMLNQFYPPAILTTHYHLLSSLLGLPSHVSAGFAINIVVAFHAFSSYLLAHQLFIVPWV
jgi:hypothetical protein